MLPSFRLAKKIPAPSETAACDRFSARAPLKPRRVGDLTQTKGPGQGMVCVDRQPTWTAREERWKNNITSGSQLVLRCDN